MSQIPLQCQDNVSIAEGQITNFSYESLGLGKRFTAEPCHYPVHSARDPAALARLGLGRRQALLQPKKHGIRVIAGTQAQFPGRGIIIRNLIDFDAVANKEPRRKRTGYQDGFSTETQQAAGNYTQTWIQRHAYGYRDEEYLRLKILTAFLPRK